MGAARDVVSVAAINRERFPVAKTTNAIDRGHRPGDDDADGKPRRWYVAVHNGARRGAVACPQRASRGRCAPGPVQRRRAAGTKERAPIRVLGAGGGAVDTLAANAAPRPSRPCAPANRFFQFEVNCEGQDVRVGRKSVRRDRTRDDDAVAEIQPPHVTARYRP